MGKGKRDALAVAVLGVLEGPQKKDAAKHSLTGRRLEVGGVFRIKPGEVLVEGLFELGIAEEAAPGALCWRGEVR